MAGWLRRLRARIRHRHFDRELAREMDAHRSMLQRDLEATGIAPEDARRRAARALGNATLAREDARGVWIAPWLQSVAQDVRHAARSLVRQPLFGAFAVTVLALGIGLVTTLVSYAYATFLRPWDVPAPDRVVYIRSRPATASPDYGSISFSELLDLEAQSRTLSALAMAVRPGRTILSDGGRTIGEVAWLQVSASYFDALGIPMILGRAFTAAEDDHRAPMPLAVITQRLWESAFAADPAVIGRRVVLGQREYIVIGVADIDGFRDYTPVRHQVAVPLAMVAAGGDQDGQFLDPRQRMPLSTVVGRLQPPSSAQSAGAELTALSERFRDSLGLPRIVVSAYDTRPLSRGGDRESWQAAQLIFLGLLLVQLLACANVGNLLLARGLARRREMAIRLSLGAGRVRLVRQLVTEAAVLASAAGLLALALPMALPALFRRFASAEEARELASQYAPDPIVFAFAFGLAALTALACGLAPALHATRVELASAAADRHGQNRRGMRLRRLLLATQLALTAVVLTSAGLLTRGIDHALTIDPGFALRELQAMAIRLPSPRSVAGDETFFRALEQALAASDGPAVALADHPPLSDSRWSITVRHLHEPDGPVHRVRYRPVSSNYFDVTGTRLLGGRPPADPHRREIVVSASAARQLWGSADPIGKALLSGSQSSELTRLEVVGIAGDTLSDTLGDVEPAIYRGTHHVNATLLVRDLSIAALDRVRALAAALEPRAVVTSRPLLDDARATLAPMVAASRVTWAIGALALLLAAVGAFGVFAYAVEERRREIGIRIALGARAAQVVRFAVGRLQGTVVAGLVVGLGLAAAAAPLLGRFLYGLSPLDPTAYGQVALLLGATAAAATWLPARRAARVDPVATLRAD